MSKARPTKGDVLARHFEEENTRLRLELQRAREDANKQYRRADELAELLTHAKQEIAILQSAASRSLMDYQQANAQRNGGWAQ